MKLFKRFQLFWIFTFGLLAATSAESTPADTFTKANEAYMEQNYQLAIELYGKLIKEGKIAPEVYFNLGNAHYKIGNIADAVLNYERANRIAPSDPDISHNLRIAYLATIDKIEPAPMVFYEQWWNDFVKSGSVHQRALITIMFLWLSLAMIAVYLFSNAVFIKKIMFFSGAAMAVAGLFTFYLTFRQHQHLSSNRGAVIYIESAYVRSSPDKSSANLFLLHAGTKIDVVDELEGWRKIRIANGNEGWIEADAMELI